MRQRTRQLTLKECYEILRLEKGADLQAVKTAYRKRAFELHPDLNPGNAEAGKQFQLLNEAYVALSAILKPTEEARQKAEAGKAESGGKSGAQDKGGAQSGRSAGQSAGAAGGTQDRAGPREQSRASAAYAEQDVLRDLLNDAFARRVFEDIYSEVDKKKQQAEPEKPKEEPKPEQKPEETPPRPEARKVKPAPPWQPGQDKGVKGVVKGWLRKQIDEEQTLVLPAAGLMPGRKIRLQIRQGLSKEVSAIEVTLPPDFAVGKPLRLRGLGKRVGPWQGDLYLTIYAQ